MTIRTAERMRHVHSPAQNVTISHHIHDAAAMLSARHGRLSRVGARSAALSLPPSLRGAGTTIGLVEPAIGLGIADLAGAILTVRHFAATEARVATLVGHGIFSATLLVGQGHRVVRGLVPAARLLVATVAEDDGIARPDSVAGAVHWLAAEGAVVIAIPMVGAEQDDTLAAALDRAAARGTVLLAAAGNDHPKPVAFPARHPCVTAVGAAGCDGRPLRECCLGPGILAPGAAITATEDGRRRVRRSGSSIATVIAAALAALPPSAQAGRSPAPLMPPGAPRPAELHAGP